MSVSAATTAAAGVLLLAAVAAAIYDAMLLTCEFEVVLSVLVTNEIQSILFLVLYALLLNHKTIRHNT